MPVPFGVRDRGNDSWHAIGHRDRLRRAHAPLLEVDLLGFPPEESVHIGLKLVSRDGLGHLVEGVDSDVGVRVLGSHDGAEVLHRKKEAVDGMAPPDGVSIL